MIRDLFADDDSLPRQWQEPLAPGALILRGFAGDGVQSLLLDIRDVVSAAPFRHLVTPGGRSMSVAMTCCGERGWFSDARGYRYVTHDELTGQRWPAIPVRLRDLARRAAAGAGYDGFEPDSCLINRYAPGSRLSLHQDKDEPDLTQPIVSLSLGLTATFLFGGLRRDDACRRVPLRQGDVVVWGGPSRLYYHGVLPLKDQAPPWPLRESRRYNLTFRRVAPARDDL
ncbi:DNA oxidative demethylase AlkB [Affinibrenneria salicis]|uniref:DNA oxidative demethylase AlkB n=1 Tax=Affinibrenneria salicis TaxID=2590031 RepID=A0A5J5G2A7_9GAMM|nr:DNA oxidative demethylase AlkB [Affinibrenneria salicis]KAA9000765.1 DNA oxidative demethylase AlkB [Affinibrenneria salicis]